MAKKRIPEVPRDGSDADFVPENYMLIDGAEGSAKMRMDLLGKASTDEELDEAKYEKPEGGIPKTDLAEGVQGSLGLADSALQPSDIEGKAEKSEMSITNVPDDTTKKTIQLKNGLSQIVVVDHQDISGKAEKSEMSISTVSGDETKMKIQLKTGASQNVVIEHQNISGKADKSEMLISAVSGDDTKKTIQLYNGLSQDVVVDISGKADATDILTSWQTVAAAPATGKLEFHSTRYPTRTEIVLKDATRPGGTVAEDVVVGYTVPSIELGNAGKYLMVDNQLGTSWQSVEHTLSYPSSTEGEYSTLRGIISFQTDNTPLRTSAYLTASNYEPTCLGMFVPPVKREDAGRILLVDENEGPVWRDPPSTDPEITWQYGDDTRQGILSVGTTFESDAPHHSSAYIEYNSSTTWLGAFVPPTDIGDIGKVLMVDSTKGVEWKSPSNLSIYTSGTGITIDPSDNSINVSNPLPAGTPGAHKILSTDGSGNLTWMPKYTSNMVSATLTGAEINPDSSIKYTYEYSIPLDWTAAVRSGHMIIEWSVVCANGRKNNPLIAVWFSKHLPTSGWNNLATVPGIIMQDSLSDWAAQSRATGYLMRDAFDFDKLQIKIYASNGVFTSTDEVNVELSIMYVGQYTMTD